jgi:type II secretory pathway component PulK
MLHHPRHRNTEHRQGFVLLAVLVVLVVLTLAAYQFGEMTLAEYKAADSARRQAQARALADSGIQYVAALLASPDAVQNTLNGNPWDNPSAFQGILVKDSEQPRFRGRFSIIAPLGPDDNTGAQTYHSGVVDESGKINLNALMQLDSSGTVAYNALMLLPNMTADIANSIVDWMDLDSEPRPNGAEDEYYTTQTPPYHCKNGPLDSLDELLLVKGVTPQLLYGNDLNRNGILDPEEEDGTGVVDLGWSAYLTVLSRELNVDAQGNPRINVNDSDLNTLMQTLTTAVGSDLANYIIAYRTYGPSSSTAATGAGAGGKGGAAGKATPSTGRSTGARTSGGLITTTTGGDSNADDTVTMARGKLSGSTLNLNRGANGGAGGGGGGGGGGARKIGSLYELVNSSVDIPSSTDATQKTRYDSPLKDPGQQQLLPLLLDECTTVSTPEIPARVNVTTAPQAVLTALPGMDANTVQLILEHRPTPDANQAPDPIYQTPAWLITQANVPTSTMQTLEKYITARTQVYRVQSVGYFDGGGPSVRLEAVIDTNAGRPRVISYRDLTAFGKAYDLTTQQ